MIDRILSNRLQEARRERGITQERLAETSGVSRAEISAIETGRLAPSTATALRLAEALDRTVEALFALTEPGGSAPSWAWEPTHPSGRFWEARVGGRRLFFPVEPTAMGSVPHDGTFGTSGTGGPQRSRWTSPEKTLVIAGCDPTVGLLAAELAREDGLRLVPLTRSSRDALELLNRGLVHAAGLHWSGSAKDANASMVARSLGTGFRLLHVARWEEGVALQSAVRARSARAAARLNLRWIAREEGSGARRVQDRLLKDNGRRFRHVARDHRAVALAVRSGYAQAGIAVRVAAEEAGVSFLTVEREDYELCFRKAQMTDGPILALRRALKRRALKHLVRDLPGHDVSRTGEERSVA